MTEFLIFFFSKIQNYSPTEAAKVYDKPLTRRTLVKFNPESVLNLMKKNKAPSDLEEEEDEEDGDRQDREKVVDDYLEVRHGANTVKFLNFRTPENLAVIYLEFKTKWPNLRVFCQKDANGIANSEVPDQTAPRGSALFAQTNLSENFTISCIFCDIHHPTKAAKYRSLVRILSEMAQTLVATDSKLLEKNVL